MPHPLSHKYPIPISQLCLVNTDVPAVVGAPPLDTTPILPREWGEWGQWGQWGPWPYNYYRENGENGDPGSPFSWIYGDHLVKMGTPCMADNYHRDMRIPCMAGHFSKIMFMDLQ